MRKVQGFRPNVSGPVIRLSVAIQPSGTAVPSKAAHFNFANQFAESKRFVFVNKARLRRLAVFRAFVSYYVKCFANKNMHKGMVKR